MHPSLIAALVDDRRTFCPRGAVASLPHRLCRSCFVRTSRPSRGLDRHEVNWCTRAWAWALAIATSVIRVHGKRT